MVYSFFFRFSIENNNHDSSPWFTNKYWFWYSLSVEETSWDLALRKHPVMWMSIGSNGYRIIDALTSHIHACLVWRHSAWQQWESWPASSKDIGWLTPTHPTSPGQNVFNCSDAIYMPVYICSYPLWSPWSQHGGWWCDDMNGLSLAWLNWDYGRDK